MIVVDTNILAYLFIDGEHSQQAKKLYLQDSDWISPFLWRSEFRNIVAVYIRNGHLNLKGGQLLVSEAEHLMHGKEYDVGSNEILEFVSISKCSAYDCEFVALAKHLNLKLYTSDKHILRAFPDIAVSLMRV